VASGLIFFQEYREIRWKGRPYVQFEEAKAKENAKTRKTPRFAKKGKGKS
jgi:hypothetical protein